MNEIYLDNAATTKIDPEVLEEMKPYLTYEYGNPGSLHQKGTSAAKAVAKAREQVANYAGAEPDQVIFTPSGSAANNMVFFSLAGYLKSIGKTHIITTKTEHDSVLRTAAVMKIKHGFDTDFLKPNIYGFVDCGDIRRNITDKTGLVSIIHTNNETGIVNTLEKDDIEELHSRGCLVHQDCVQASVSDMPGVFADFFSISAHKIHGPKGIGALIARDKDMLDPVIYGGEEQEFGLIGGTENVANIVGFGKACELAFRGVQQGEDIMISHLRNLFIDLLTFEFRGYIPDKGEPKFATIGDFIGHNPNTLPDLFSPKILGIRFPGIDAETLVLALASKGVYISAGSACRAHEAVPSSTLLAMGFSPEEARETVRISFSKYNTSQEIANAAKIIAETVGELHER